MQGFSLEKMVGGVLADTRELMRKHASTDTDDEVREEEFAAVEDLAHEGEKLASALEYVADRLEEGDLAEDAPETSLEEIKQAYAIVEQIEADPKLKLKIAAAAGQIPRSPGMGKGIIPGKAPSTALANDLNDRPGGGGRQQRSRAKAPAEFQIPHSPAAARSVAPGGAPDAMLTDLDDRPGGGGSYPEKGVIRTKSAADKVHAWGKVMKTAGEFSHDPAKDEGNRTAKVSGGKSQGPLGKPKGAHAWGEGPRSQMPVEIQTSAGARDYTKAQAKQRVAADLAKVLSHPAFSKKHDDVTSKNLSASGVSKLAVSGKEYRSAKRRLQMENISGQKVRSKRKGALIGGALGAGYGALMAPVYGDSVGGSALGHGLAGAAGGALMQHRSNLQKKHQTKLLDAHQRNMAERRGQSALKTASADPTMQKLAGLANSELLDRALRGEIDPDVLTKLADQVGPEGAGGVDASTGITINDASSGTVAPDDKAVAFRQALEQSARHTGEGMHQSSDVVGMPGGSAGDSTPAIPSY